LWKRTPYRGPHVPARIRTSSACWALILPILLRSPHSYAIWYRSIRKIGVAPAMALNISYAMWGALFAWSLYHTPVTLLAISGCAVVTAGAIIAILSGRHQPTVDLPAGRRHPASASWSGKARTTCSTVAKPSS